jgi:hypothetical protein
MANKQSGQSTRYSAGYGGPQPPKSNTPLIAAGAVVAVAAIVALVLVLTLGNSSTSAAASSPGVNPAPSQGYASGGTGSSSGALGQLPPLGGNGGGLTYMLNGTVSAISGTSITLAGSGPSVTAAINGSTKVTGKVTSVSGIKVGDQVVAQVSGQSSSSLVATAIQDPGTGP